MFRTPLHYAVALKSYSSVYALFAGFFSASAKRYAADISELEYQKAQCIKAISDELDKSVLSSAGGYHIERKKLAWPVHKWFDSEVARVYRQALIRNEVCLQYEIGFVKICSGFGFKC